MNLLLLIPIISVIISVISLYASWRASKKAERAAKLANNPKISLGNNREDSYYVFSDFDEMERLGMVKTFYNNYRLNIKLEPDSFLEEYIPEQDNLLWNCFLRNTGETTAQDVNISLSLDIVREQEKCSLQPFNNLSLNSLGKDEQVNIFKTMKQVFLGTGFFPDLNEETHAFLVVKVNYIDNVGESLKEFFYFEVLDYRNILTCEKEAYAQGATVPNNVAIYVCAQIDENRYRGHLNKHPKTAYYLDKQKILSLGFDPVALLSSEKYSIERVLKEFAYDELCLYEDDIYWEGEKIDENVGVILLIKGNQRISTYFACEEIVALRLGGEILLYTREKTYFANKIFQGGIAGGYNFDLIRADILENIACWDPDQERTSYDLEWPQYLGIPDIELPYLENILP